MSLALRKLGNTEYKRFKFLEYVRTLCGALLEAVILIVFAVAAYAALLYFFKMLWHVYIATDVGRYYVAEFPVHARSTANILGRNMLEFSLGMTILAFLVCIVAASICRVSHLARVVYINRGLLGRIVFCGLPIAAVVALLARPKLGIPEWNSAYTYALVPTLMVFARCFDIADRLFPEIGDVRDRIKALFMQH